MLVSHTNAVHLMGATSPKHYLPLFLYNTKKSSEQKFFSSSSPRQQVGWWHNFRLSNTLKMRTANGKNGLPTYMLANYNLLYNFFYIFWLLGLMQDIHTSTFCCHFD